jgi:myo-inositol-1(or 4)-monophosphatase
MSNYLEKATEVAKESGALLKDLFHRPHEISYKRRADLLTEADKRSEAMIVQFLRRTYPSHDIVGEEGGGIKTGSDYCWYVDPLDGTTNYAHGFPVFCTTLGLSYRNEVIAGVVYDPMREELFNAEKGSGAFLNGERLQVSETATLGESLLATGFPPFATNHDLNIECYFRFTMLSHGIRRAGSAALDFCSVASGRYEGFWEFKLNPWDKAAGSLMVTEAGGRVTSISNGAFELLADEVYASNGLVHDEMLKVFQQILAERKAARI